MKFITAEDLHNRLQESDSIKLVAVVDTWKHQQIRIPGALNFSNVQDAITSLNQDDDIILYCSGWPCVSSTWAYRLLSGRGYKNLTIFRGGLAEWQAKGYPLIDETP